MSKRRPWAARKKLDEDRDTLLRQYYTNGGDMRDYRLLSQLTGLTPAEIDKRSRALGLFHTAEG